MRYFDIPLKDYIGMNFKEWCALDEEDTRTLHIELESEKSKEHFSFISNCGVTPLEMIMIQKSVIKNIELIDNEWYVELVYKF